jgi:hypothetical protein
VASRRPRQSRILRSESAAAAPARGLAVVNASHASAADHAHCARHARRLERSDRIRFDFSLGGARGTYKRRSVTLATLSADLLQVRSDRCLPVAAHSIRGDVVKQPDAPNHSPMERERISAGTVLAWVGRPRCNSPPRRW